MKRSGRGLDISYETVRRWVLKSGRKYAHRLRSFRPRPDDRWHPDEMVVAIRGKRMYPWRAVDSEGAILPNITNAGSTRTLGLRIRTNPSDDENESCSASSQPGQPRVSLPSTPPSTTTSTANAISSHENRTDCSALPRSRPGDTWPFRREPWLASQIFPRALID